MREIEFRGIRKDDGKWVYGYYFKTWEQAYILWGTINGIPHMVEVIPETVGQYTGLKDKNGVEICEGDNLQTTHHGIGRVIWSDNSSAWHIKPEKEPGQDVFLCDYSSETLEVIGNIHENPEENK